MRYKKWDIVICICLAAILSIFVFELRKITPIARVYPQFVLAGSYIMIAIVLYQSARPSSKGPAAQSGSGDPPLTRPFVIRIVIYCISILVYLLCIGLLGYIFSTIAFCVFSLLFLKNKNKLVVVLVPVLMALVMYYIFYKLLYVRLPTGTLIERFL